MWAILFVLSNGTNAWLDMPDATQQREKHCMEYAERAAEAFNALSGDLKIIDASCWRNA